MNLKEKIKQYFQTHEKAYWSDLAIRFNVAPHEVAKACLELQQEGILAN